MKSDADEPNDLDSGASTPLYRQVADVITREVASGELSANQQIPSEKALTERFGISRMTLRKAVSLLVDNGILVRQQGRGTFVRPSVITYGLDKLKGTTEALREAGMDHQSAVLVLERRNASPEVARALQLGSDSHEVVFFRRTDSAGATPVAVCDVYVPVDVGDRLSRSDLESMGLYPLLDSKTGVPTFSRSGYQTLQAVPCDAETANLLKYDVGSPIMHIERIAYDVNGRPIEFSRVRMRGDTVKFGIRLALRGEDGTSLPMSIESFSP